MNIYDIEQADKLDLAEQKGIRGGTSVGINALIAVSQLKSQFANEDTLGDASDQRSLVSQDKAPPSGKNPISSKLSKNPWSF